MINPAGVSAPVTLSLIKVELTINWPSCLIKTPAIILYDNFYEG